jgi:hypothetical protein
MRKARRSPSIPLSVKIPPRKVREKFLLIYELEGSQKTVNLLTGYYGVRRMKMILNGRKVGKDWEAYYLENRAYFSKKGLKKRTVLHELYHHLIYNKGVEIPERIEEQEAKNYARNLLTNR